MSALPWCCALLCVGLTAAAWGQLEAPPAAFETTPWPAEGEELAANPPAFVWIPAEPADAYQVEYSRDRDFPPDATITAQTPWLIHVPQKALASGRWYWRWRPAGSDETSPIRSFVIREDAVVVPFPDVAEMLEGIGTSRPRVIVQADGLAHARAWSAETQEVWLAKLKASAQRVLAEDLTPEPEFLPPRGDPARGPAYTQAFRAMRPVYSKMNGLAMGYLLSGDEETGQAARRMLMNFVSWDPEGSTSLRQNDELGTEFVRMCPRAYDWIYPTLTDAERAECRRVFEIRMREMYSRWHDRPFERHPYESHNMGYYLPDLTEACLAMAGEMDVEEMLRYCLSQLWSPFYPGDDGGWQEGPPYWGWIMSVVCRLYGIVERATGVPISSRSSMRNAALYKIYGNPPWSKMSPFGDGQAKPAGGGTTMLELAALYNDPHALWYADYMNTRLSGLNALMFDASDIEARSPMDLPQSRCFFSTGEACMHTALWSGASDVQVLLRSCPFGGISHAYADQNTFVLDAWGEPLIIASGYYPYYGHPNRVNWSIRTRASNSILVNGEGQPKPWNWDAKGKISRFVTTDGADYAVGDATLAYPGLLKRYLRKMLFVRPLQTGGPTLIAIHDDLLAEKPSSFQWLLHSLEEMDVNTQAQQVTIKRGEAACRVSYLMPEGLAFTQTDQFPPDAEVDEPNQWHLTASLDEAADARQSLIVIEPYRAARGERPLDTQQIEGESCVAALVTDGDVRHLLLFGTGDVARVPSLDVVTDAEAVAVTMRGDEVLGFFAAGATKLTVGDTALVDSQARADASSVITAGEPLALDAKPLFQIGDDAPVPMTVERYPMVRQVRCTAEAPVGGHYEIVLRGRATTDRPCPVTIVAGGSEATWVPPSGDDRAEFVTDAISLMVGARIAIMFDGATGGACEIEQVTARRVYNHNLLPNSSFEEVGGDGVPASWRPGTITNGAKCTLASAPEGRTGDRCLQITCTKAGGDFGATLRWPGVAPVDFDRRFRVGVWVRNGTDSRVGIQVTNRTWKFHQTTGKPSGCAEWTETASEFVLPAGEDLSNLRLHMSADAGGAVMFADDAFLIELAP
jgi:hypothetical protein